MSRCIITNQHDAIVPEDRLPKPMQGSLCFVRDQGATGSSNVLAAGHLKPNVDGITPWES